MIKVLKNFTFISPTVAKECIALEGRVPGEKMNICRHVNAKKWPSSDN